GGCHRFDDTRQRRQVVLVRRQFVRGQAGGCDGRLAGNVGREFGERVTELETFGHVPIVAYLVAGNTDCLAKASEWSDKGEQGGRPSAVRMLSRRFVPSSRVTGGPMPESTLRDEYM